jgi:hypothetical protein
MVSVFRLVLSAPAILTAEKSFRRNPAIGSPALNARGLHRRRVALAAAMAARRRAALAPLLDPAERAAFDRDGFVIRDSAIPRDLLVRLQHEIATVPRRSWELRQGETVARFAPLPAREDGSAVRALAHFVRSADIRTLVGYAGGRTGHLLAMLQTVIVTPGTGEPDPQANLHADTFHPTAKLWLFLHDVGEEDGPFAYAPGSHRLTPERLDWEHEAAISATASGDRHHAAGSFRLADADLARLGYAACRTFPVSAGTLVVADTYGFHRRTPSHRPTARTALYGVLRRNPFVPWNGGDLMDLPLVRDRTMAVHLALEDRRARAGKAVVYRAAGALLPSDPPRI